MSGVLPADLPGRLQECRRWLNELKNRQLVGGDNLVVRTTESSAAYDTTTVIPAGGTYEFSVTFTADDQHYPFANLDLLFYWNSPGTLVVPRTRIEERLVSDAAPRATTWDVAVSNPDDLAAHTFYIKKIVRATDTGTIS